MNMIRFAVSNRLCEERSHGGILASNEVYHDIVWYFLIASWVSFFHFTFVSERLARLLLTLDVTVQPTSFNFDAQVLCL